MEEGYLILVNGNFYCGYYTAYRDGFDKVHSTNVLGDSPVFNDYEIKNEIEKIINYFMEYPNETMKIELINFSENIEDYIKRNYKSDYERGVYIL